MIERIFNEILARNQDDLSLPQEVIGYWIRVIWNRDQQEVGNRKEVNEEFIIQRQSTVEEVKSIPKSVNVLDICCGTGKIAEEILSLESVIEYIGIDINPSAINTTRNRLTSINISASSYKLYLGDIYEICRDIPSKSIDVIICIDALHHLRDPCKLLIEIKRILRHNGCFISNVLRRETFFEWEIKRHGIIKFLLMNINYHFCRLLYKYIDSDLLRTNIGISGSVRLMPYSKTTLTTLINTHLELVRLQITNYYWFVATSKQTEE